jgi:sulfate transport system ATP-binding protein
MDHGKIEQVGAPRDLYDQPANSFVMSFLGPVSKLGTKLVRPHDIALSQHAIEGAAQAMVSRVVHLGFEVRVDLMLAEGQAVEVQLTRHEADELELSSGDIVWLRTAGAAALRA